ncbi:MAG: radical SAM family heme chaperone HemW, partial [Phaeodactylibacter sp.]|nr:radical SAM family heme chaperone HemW [Phaeodactylibacter sp.]
AEITLEANPDDLSEAYLMDLRSTSINRLSIGIQSFFEDDLRFMNRAHNADEAINSIKAAQDAGFENITIDLIYGSPTTSDEHWQANLQKAIELQVPHLSCYCLTIEPKTAFGHWVEKGRMAAPDEAQAERQFNQLMDQTEKAGYLHYEISNFAQPGMEAVHNSNYWQGVPYLGIGPAAHSFNGETRQWNIAHNIFYMDSIRGYRVPAEVETLSQEERYNEYLMTALRTYKGVQLDILQRQFPDFLPEFEKDIKPYLQSGHLSPTDTGYRLSRSGKHLADRIASDLFRL